MMDIFSDYYVWIIIAVIVILMIIIGYIAEKTNFGKKRFSEKKKSEKTKENSVTKVIAPTEEKHDSKNNKEEKEETWNLDDPVGNEAFYEQAPTENVSSQTWQDGDSQVESNQEDLNVPLNEMPMYQDSYVVEETAPLTEETASYGAVEDLNAPLEGATEFYQPVDDSLNEMPMYQTSYVTEEAAPLTEGTTSYGMAEDLNAPFGDMPISEGTSRFDSLGHGSYEEDLTAPIEARASRGERAVHMDLPDIDSVKENVSRDTDDDDIWKF